MTWVGGRHVIFVRPVGPRFFPSARFLRCPIGTGVKSPGSNMLDIRA